MQRRRNRRQRLREQFYETMPLEQQNQLYSQDRGLIDNQEDRTALSGWAILGLIMLALVLLLLLTGRGGNPGTNPSLNLPTTASTLR